MKEKKRTSGTRKRQEVKMDCFFCKEKKIPDFLEYEILTKFTSERGKIQARGRTGVCSRHQRRLTDEIKRARYIGFLPYVVRPE